MCMRTHTCMVNRIKLMVCVFLEKRAVSYAWAAVRIERDQLYGLRLKLCSVFCVDSFALWTSVTSLPAKVLTQYKFW